ncbi:MAG: hypothetical protein ABEI58_03490 [Candidatus Nanohaloarchaea archaeon]
MTEIRTIEDVNPPTGGSEILGHMEVSISASEVRELEYEDELVLYREVNDRDQARGDLRYPAIYGFAEGESYWSEKGLEARDYREVPEETRPEVEEEFSELFAADPVWVDEEGGALL